MSAADGRIAFESAQVVSSKRGLTGLDWTIIVVYLGSMIGVGVYWYLRDRQGTASEFFLGSRSIPFWAAGVSLYATNTSSISYIAIPAKAFETDWQYMMNKLITIVGLMFVAVWIVPLLRRLDLVSVFNYLEMRFHPAIRMIGSALCMAMHVGGRMSVVLFLPALAIATITGIDVVISILIMGVCTIVYTAMGGMRAVVWTDFVQVIVLMGGAVFAIFFVFNALGSDAIFETAAAFDKTKLVNLSFDLTQPTVWGFLFLILFDVVLTFPKDQVLMQRTLATDSPKAAGRSIWMFAAIMLPGGLIFYGIGTVLFAYYKAHPERLDPLLPIDATFPLFISAELPAGLTGLIIAGIFAAAMGTLSGTINSIATLLSVDFYAKLTRNRTEQQTKRFAEWMTVVVGRGRHRPGAAPVAPRHPFAAGPDDRDGGAAGRWLRRRLHARHVHAARELGGRVHRRCHGNRRDHGGLVEQPGASVLLPRHLDRHVHRRGLPRQPVLPGADALACGPDHLQGPCARDR